MANETDPSDSASSALTRRLATMLSSDVAGYSRIMGENEEATGQTLRGHRAVFDALLDRMKNCHDAVTCQSAGRSERR